MDGSAPGFGFEPNLSLGSWPADTASCENTLHWVISWRVSICPVVRFVLIMQAHANNLAFLALRASTGEPSLAPKRTSHGTLCHLQLGR